jgi:hypothetical protein
MGIVFWGFLTSSAAVVIASNPIVSEKDDSSPSNYSSPPVWKKRMIIGRINIIKPYGDE